MNVHNHLPFVVDVRSTHDRDGYEYAALMLKATFNFPELEKVSPAIAVEQKPWVYTDILGGSSSNPISLYEAELPHEKLHAEYMVVGSAHSLDGKPQRHLPFGLSVGKHTKHLAATGPRLWRSGWIRGRAEEITPVDSVPLSYALSFGGCDPSRPTLADGWYHANPGGTGYCADPRHRLADGMPLPQMEPIAQRFERPCRKFPVVGLGPVGRNSSPRASWAGTYDQAWQDEVWPRLPSDFDARFLQSASPDQWLPAIQAGDEVILKRLTAARSRFGSEVRFQLPAMDFVATVHPRHGNSTRVQLRPDTLVLDPEDGRFMVIAKRWFPLRDGLHELEAVAFGEPKDREKLAPIVPTFIDLDDFRDQLRARRPFVLPPAVWGKA